MFRMNVGNGNEVHPEDITVSFEDVKGVSLHFFIVYLFALFKFSNKTSCACCKIVIITDISHLVVLILLYLCPIPIIPTWHTLSKPLLRSITFNDS